MRVDLGIKGKVTIDESLSHASATSTLISDLVSELFASTSTKTVTPIDKIVFVDDAGAERDSVSVSSTDWTVSTSPPYISVTKQITATANYTLAKVRLKSGTKIYFEGSVSKTIVSGRNYTVTAQINITHSITNISPSNATVNPSGLLNDILKALRLTQESRGSLTFTYVEWGASATDIRLSISLTKDTSTRTISHATTNFTTSGSLRYVYVYYASVTPGEPTIIFDLGTTYTVTTSDTCSFAWSFNIA